MTDLRKVKIGTIRGPQGYSAYQVAVQNGFVGTEAEWLESLRGEPTQITITDNGDGTLTA